MRLIWPPRDKQFLFHMERAFSKFSTIGSQNTLDLAFAPVGKPSYNIGNFLNFKRSKLVCSCISSSELPNATSKLLPKLILKQEMISKDPRILLITTISTNLIEL